MSMKNEVLDLLAARRSCRSFQPDQLSKDTLALIVEAGRRAPSAMNRQQCHFYVITDPAWLERITNTVSQRLEGAAGRDCRYGAPALVVVTGRRDNGCALQDAACAMENMMISAAALGVGSCWINQLFHLRDDEEMIALLAEMGVSKEEFPCASLSLGLPAGPLFPGQRELTGCPVTWLEEK